MTDPVDIDEGERLLELSSKLPKGRWDQRRAQNDYEEWLFDNGYAMLAELRALRNQVAQLTQARDAGNGGDDA